MKFLLENCTFKPLTEDLIKTCENFDCDHKDLNEFFSKDCINYSNQLLGKTYCFTLDENPNIIICAFTVANASIDTINLPRSRKDKIKKLFPKSKRFRSYPAVLIGRLGVNKKFKKHGLGCELMDFIKSWFIDPNNKTGCRFIVVDSYNEKIPINYYLKNGFDFLFSSKEQEMECTGTKILKTRLMHFDLILLSSN